MSRRKPEARCAICKMRQELCLCAEIAKTRAQLPQLDTKIFILMHHREAKLPTNTGRLAQLAIPSCEVRIRGLEDQPLNPEGILDEARQPLFLYPSESSVPLNEVAITKPVTLILADGNWRQASKVAKREAFLQGVPQVHLMSERPSQYRLRSEPKPQGLATFEAVVRALGILEGARGPELERILDELFALMVSRTLGSRGQGAL